jgi:hypothetical protein
MNGRKLVAPGRNLASIPKTRFNVRLSADFFLITSQTFQIRYVSSRNKPHSLFRGIRRRCSNILRDPIFVSRSLYGEGVTLLDDSRNSPDVQFAGKPFSGIEGEPP